MGPGQRIIKVTALQNRLALHRFICREFGYEGLPAMLERLRDAPAGFTGSGESEYARALYLNPNLAAVTPDQLSTYDAHIAAHSRKLRMNGEQGREWKPYQYLALLFTERYLSRYFDDPEKLCADLNKTKAEDRPTAAMPDYDPEDLRTVAFQSATGSGKTLLMHAHILQIPTLPAPFRRTAQQHRPADAQRADVVAARARVAGKRPAGQAVFR